MRKKTGSLHPEDARQVPKSGAWDPGAATYTACTLCSYLDTRISQLTIRSGVWRTKLDIRHEDMNNPLVVGVEPHTAKEMLKWLSQLDAYELFRDGGEDLSKLESSQVSPSQSHRSTTRKRRNWGTMTDQILASVNRIQKQPYLGVQARAEHV